MGLYKETNELFMKRFHEMLMFQKLKEAFHDVCKYCNLSGPRITWLVDSSCDRFLVDGLMEKSVGSQIRQQLLIECLKYVREHSRP